MILDKANNVAAKIVVGDSLAWARNLNHGIELSAGVCFHFWAPGQVMFPVGREGGKLPGYWNPTGPPNGPLRQDYASSRGKVMG